MEISRCTTRYVGFNLAPAHFHAMLVKPAGTHAVESGLVFLLPSGLTQETGITTSSGFKVAAASRVAALV